MFVGKYGLTEFRFSEFKMTKEDEVTDTDGTSTKQTVTVFEGILFAADFKKNFNGLTIIETKIIKANKGIGKLMGKLINGAGSISSKRAHLKIELESEEFNLHFIVQTNNEIEARYILSSTFMEQMVSFVQHHPNPITISFYDSYMFIAVSSTKNLFDEGITKKSNIGYSLQGIYNDLATFFQIIEHFDLNTRIWTKQ